MMTRIDKRQRLEGRGAGGPGAPLGRGRREAAGEGTTGNRDGIGEVQIESRAVVNAQTGAEARLWEALRNRRLAHWNFRRQHPIDRFIVDFVAIHAA
jgi:Protein of unknown function (DUF559)